jgi:glycosyltransferase involved in cell wall biosynthesis
MTSVVSVVIPVHNGMRYLEQAVESVLSQPEVNEVIVVDDGAPEPVPESVQDCTRVRVVSQPRSGPGAARNAGVRLAASDVVAFLDADDQWLPSKLARQLESFGCEGPSYSTAAFRYLIEEDVRLSAEAALTAQGAQRGDIPSTLVLARDAFFRVGPFAENLKTAEDVEWFLRASRKGVASIKVSEVLVLKRLWRGGVTSSASSCNDDLFAALRTNLRSPARAS